MITIKYRDAEGRRELTVEGHAGAAPLGQDIYCAGASALCIALCSALRHKGIETDAEARSGYFRCAVRRDEGADIYHTVMCGLYELAEEYPRYYTIRS